MAKKIQVDLELKDKATGKVKKFTTNVDRSFSTLGRSSKKLNDGFSKITKTLTLMAAAATVLAAVKVVGFFKESVQAASDLQETTSKFGAVFKEQADAVRVWAKELQDAYGLSRRASLEFLASTQDLFVPLGVAADKAAKLSLTVAKLAVDMSSFYNLPHQKVLDDIQSALVGNGETMKKYGVIVNETSIKAKAAFMGMGEGALTAAQKSQAALQIVIDGTKAAEGDWARTAGGYANTVKRYESTMEDFKAAVGKHLLPPLTEIIEKTGDWLKANEDIMASKMGSYVESIGKSIKTLIDVIVEYKTELLAMWEIFKFVLGGAVAIKLAAVIAKISLAVQGISVAAGTAGATFIAMANGITIAITAAGALGAVIGTLLLRFQVVQEAGIAMVAGLHKSFLHLTFGIQAAWLEFLNVFNQVIYAVELRWAQFINMLKETAPDFLKSWLGIENKMVLPIDKGSAKIEKRITELYTKWVKESKRVDDAYADIFNSVGKVTDEIEKAAGETKKLGDAAEKAAKKTRIAFKNTGVGEFTASLDDATKSYEAWKRGMSRPGGGFSNIGGPAYDALMKDINRPGVSFSNIGMIPSADDAARMAKESAERWEKEMEALKPVTPKLDTTQIDAGIAGIRNDFNTLSNMDITPIFNEARIRATAQDVVSYIRNASEQISAGFREITNRFGRGKGVSEQQSLGLARAAGGAQRREALQWSAAQGPTDARGLGMSQQMAKALLALQKQRSMIFEPKIKMSAPVPFKEGIENMKRLLSSVGEETITPIVDVSAISMLIEGMQKQSEFMLRYQPLGPQGAFSPATGAMFSRAKDMYEIQTELLQTMMRQSRGTGARVASEAGRPPVAGATQPNINITINAVEGQSAEEMARTIREELIKFTNRGY